MICTKCQCRPFPLQRSHGHIRLTWMGAGARLRTRGARSRASRPDMVMRPDKRIRAVRKQLRVQLEFDKRQEASD